MKPIVCEGVILYAIQEGADDNIHYRIANARGDEYEISKDLYHAFDDSEDNGFLVLPPHLKHLQPQLEEYGLISTSRFLGECDYILLQIGKSWERYMPLWKMLSILLPIVSVFLFSVGLYMTLHRALPSGHLDVVLLLIMMVVSSLVHKFCHLVAGLSYGIRFQYLNLFLIGGIIPGMLHLPYLDNPDATLAKRAYFSVSGIEGNLLMAGITMLIALCCPFLSVTMLVVATMNTVWAIMNLLPWYGFDGERVLSTLIGVDSISVILVKCLLNRKCRQHYFKADSHGMLCLILCCYTLLAYILLALAFVSNCLKLVF